MKRLVLTLAILAVPAFAHAGAASPQRTAIAKALEAKGISIKGQKLSLKSVGGPVSPIGSWSVKGFEGWKGTPGGEWVKASGSLRVLPGNKMDISIGSVKTVKVLPAL